MFAMVALAAPTALAEDRGEMPAEDDFFWDIFAEMTTPEDYSGCVSALNTYVSNHPEEFGSDVDQVVSQMTAMCTGVGQMRTDMQNSMAAEGAETSLFDNTTDWHHVDNLYFQKNDDGILRGRISFSETIDFMSYRFFNFMNNFGNMVRFNDGYISLNAAMVPEMIDYGTTFTMYGLEFEEQPDIYVSNGATMRKAVEGTDLSGISYDVAAGTLTFAPGHFSSFKAVEKNSTMRTMKITSVKKKSIKYKANKNSFNLTIRGRNFRQGSGEADCTLGFKQAQRIRVSKNGRQLKCTFQMSEFSVTGYYPLTVTVDGVGEVTRTNAVRIR
jgi:hypothetical protein